MLPEKSEGSSWRLAESELRSETIGAASGFACPSAEIGPSTRLWPLSRPMDRVCQASAQERGNTRLAIEMALKTPEKLAA